MTIEELLSEPGQQDKHQNLSTTSFRFKQDLWNFFRGFQDKNALELGTHKGQTTRILSFLFKKVFTVNLPNHFDSAMELNRDRDNIEYIPLDLYSKQQLIVGDEISMAFIDANHEYECVMRDFDRIMTLNLSSECYVVFDDYGSDYTVNIAVLDLLEADRIYDIKPIGYSKGHSFGGTPERILKDSEGIICRIKNS